MRVRFRVWMPLIAVFIVLLSVALTLFYGIPAGRSRLEDYAKDRLMDQATAAADAIAAEEGQNPRPSLQQAADSSNGEAVFVDPDGRVMERAGSNLLSPEPELLRQLAREAAGGGSIEDEIGELDVSVAPVVYGDDIAGGVVLASKEAENAIYPLVLRSSLEAAGIAAVLGGGLMVLLATLLSRRVERLAFGARSIERGDFSYRLEPGFDDELGELAKTFNAMATRLGEFVVRLEEKNATLSTILDTLTEGVLMTDAGGRVVFVNRTAHAMLGIRGEPYGELPDPWEDFSLLEAVARCVAERECVEARVRSGESFLHLKLHPLPGSKDQEGGALVVVQDLSEGRQLEANQQRFLANAAHEFKTPITGILGATELLLTGDQENPELRHRFLENIFDETLRLQRLSETLLRLARTGQDLREPELETVDLAGVARATVGRMEPLAEGAGLQLRLEGRGGHVLADREWLEQALLIIANNAIQHSRRKGRVRMLASGGTVTVEDKGVGIGEADLSHVFERFYRGKRDSGGFGLGLPICKELVERMGGNITLRSREGEGTTVTIELPEVGNGAEDTDSRG